MTRPARTARGPLLIMILALTVFTGPAAAKDRGDPPLSVTVQALGPKGGEQTALIFRGATVELVTSSNFLAPSSGREERLGRFTAPLGDSLARLRAVVADARERRKRVERFLKTLEGPARTAKPAHRVQVWVGDVEVPEVDEIHAILSEWVFRARRSAEWEPLDGLSVRPVAGKVGLESLLVSGLGASRVTPGPRPLSALGCSPASGFVRCVFRGYGVLHFTQR